MANGIADEDADTPPLTVAEGVLANLAPGLASHVHTFLHAGSDTLNDIFVRLHPGTSSIEEEFRLDALRERLGASRYTKRDNSYKIAVLAAAVMLQGIVLYKTVKKEFSQP